MSDEDPVVVTAAGVVSPYGEGLDAALAGLAAGQVCAEQRSVAGVSAMIAAVPPLSAELEALRAERRPAQAFLASAVRQALVGAPRPQAFYFGTCSGEMQRFEAWLERLTKGERPGDERAFYEMPAARVAEQHGLPAPVVFTSACTSALTALQAAFVAVASGRVDSALAAGSDATCAFAASGFLTLKAASAAAAKPFAKSRGGLNFGEGAAAVVLERESLAVRAGRKAIARVHGVGLSGDAKHVTAPRQDALGLSVAVEQALAGWPHGSVDVYVTHGTGTTANDAMELALGARFSLLGKPWIVHKAFIGHAMGASGLISFVLANEQMRSGARTGVSYDDVEAGVILNASLAGAKRAVASAAAFGGSNAAVAWEAL
jgi:3-oxoacyl-(acyl-carrier-protein) synthase